MAAAEMRDRAGTTEESDNFGSADLTDTSTPSSTPPSLTHDTSRARFHIKDLGYFASCLENSAKRAFPTQGRSCSRYKSAQALLLMWEDDELGVDNELDGLHQVFTKYGFNTETWLIPSDNPHLKLTLKAANFVEKYESEDCLLIVYYGGHAAINSARQSSWYCKDGPEFASISLEWSAIQTVFERAVSDVLLLLDCCYAASAAPMAGRAITETIAACGWEAIAPLPGRWSFTSALIEVLDDWIDRSFSVAMLHSKVLSVLKHEQPERRGKTKRKVECRRTPVYIHTSAEPGIPSINLSRLPSKELPEAKPTVGIQVASDGQGSSDMDNTQINPDTCALDDLTGSEPTGDLKVPHVLISLALLEDQELDVKDCSKWLGAFPALAKYATVKGVYRSHSTLIIASVPVVIWDLLPENRACSFIAYVTSDNLLDLGGIPKGTTVAASGQILKTNDDAKARNYATIMTPRQTPSSPRQELMILDPIEKEPLDVVEPEPSFTTNTRILPSSWAHQVPDPILVSLDLPSEGLKSQCAVSKQSGAGSSINKMPQPYIVGVSGTEKGLPMTCVNCLTRNTPLWRQNLEGQFFCDACGLYLMHHGVPKPLSSKADVIEEAKAEEEIRTGINPEKRKQLSDTELPNLKEREDIARRRFKNIEVEEWRSQAGNDTDTDDKASPIIIGSPIIIRSPFNSRRARTASEILRDDVPIAFLQDNRMQAEDELIDPVSDSESIRENQLKEEQIYFNPRAKSMGAGDRSIMQKSRHWIDGPEYPYVTKTHNQAPSAVESAKRWNEAADTYSVLSRTATWGTRRRHEPDINEIVCDNGGSFLKLFSLRIREGERRSPSVSLFDKLGSVLRGKSDKKLKRIRDSDPLVESTSRLPISSPMPPVVSTFGAKPPHGKKGSYLQQDVPSPVPRPVVSAWSAAESGKSEWSRSDSVLMISPPPQSSVFSEDLANSTVATEYSRNEEHYYYPYDSDCIP